MTAVNGAGESDPSNNVTIPSLPDIGPVTASLTHQVWKSGGEIMVNVSFEVRELLYYPTNHSSVVNMDKIMHDTMFAARRVLCRIPNTKLQASV